jgi:hypothetical protein
VCDGPNIDGTKAILCGGRPSESALLLLLAGDWSVISDFVTSHSVGCKTRVSGGEWRHSSTIYQPDQKRSGNMKSLIFAICSLVSRSHTDGMPG